MCALPSKILEHGQSSLRNSCVHFHSEIYPCLGLSFLFFSPGREEENHITKEFQRRKCQEIAKTK